MKIKYFFFDTIALIIAILVLIALSNNVKNYILKYGINKATKSVGAITISVTKDSIDSLPASFIKNGTCFVGSVKNEKIIISAYHLIKNSRVIMDSLVVKNIRAKMIIQIKFPEDRFCEVDSILYEEAQDGFVVIVPKKPNNLPPSLRFGDSDKMGTLDDCIAIGRYYHLPPLVTSGKIIETKVVGMLIFLPTLEDYILSTAHGSPGSSGGVLLNTNREVIGINVGTITENNFLVSVPINRLKNFLKNKKTALNFN